MKKISTYEQGHENTVIQTDSTLPLVRGGDIPCAKGSLFLNFMSRTHFTLVVKISLVGRVSSVMERKAAEKEFSG